MTDNARMTAVTLFRSANSCGAGDVGTHVPPDSLAAVAFISRPNAFVVARARGGGIFEDAAGTAAGFADAYEAVIFCPAWELKWLRTPEGGQVTLISDTPLHREGEKMAPGLLKAPCDLKYLMWKDPALPGKRGGWSKMANARVGSIDIPVAKPGPYRLEAREYFVREKDHGNVAFAFQRLLQFVPDKGGGS
jgi:hypothetical protein